VESNPRIKQTLSLHVADTYDFSPDGRFLASASNDRSVCIWDMHDGSRRRSWDGAANFMSVTFSPNGRYVAAGGGNGLLYVWNVRTGSLVAKCTTGGGGVVDLKAVLFTPDGKGILTGANILQFWDASSLADIQSGRHMMKDASQLNQIWDFNGNKVRLPFHPNIITIQVIPSFFHGKGLHHRSLQLFRWAMASWEFL
jgi:WD40 repeat protein